MSKNKGQDIIPLDEDDENSFTPNGFSGGDGFSDDSNESIVYEGAPIGGETIKTFSFNTISEDKGHSTDINIESTHKNISQNNNSQDNKTNSFKPQNLSTSPVQKVRGLTPKIDDEAFDIKRCYQFRASTLKKLNQLKGESDNFNIYLNEIIDAAICFYHDAVFNKK